MIDSHCHLDYEPMFSNLEKVIKRAKDSDVKLMLTIFRNGCDTVVGHAFMIFISVGCVK